MRILVPVAILALALPTAAPAAEIFGGLYSQAVKTPLSLDSNREDGGALSVGIRGGGIAGTPLQPYALGSVSLDGGTNFLVAGLSAKFGDRLYVRPGLGLAIHDGSAAKFSQPDRLAFGSRVLFAPELAIGARVTDRVSVEASLLHFSHAQLFGKQNPGIDNVGVRVNVRL